MDRYLPGMTDALRGVFESVGDDPELEALFRGRQLQAVLRLTPLTLFANCCNAAVICRAFWGSANPVLLLTWSALVILSACAGIPTWRRWRAGRLAERMSPRVVRRAVRNACILALLWAALPVALFAGGDGDQQLLLTAIVAGMICAGGFALATIPQAAIAYVLILGAGAALALNGTHLEVTVLLVVYAAIVVAAVLATARTFRARLVAEADAERQRQLVGLLLHDFEEHASDWLWEVDGHGHLSHVSNRLAEYFRRPAAELLEKPFVDLIEAGFDSGDDEVRTALDALREQLSGCKPFRELAVPIRVGQELRWWALTAKPLLTADDSVAGWRGVGADITAAQRAGAEMNRLANFDALTGLANRNLFRAQLEALQRGADGEPRPCALLFLDLDNFKAVNDSLGHGAGDQLLAVAAGRLRARVQRSDLLARIGGDEFALICWGEFTPEALAALAQRLLDAVREPCVIDGAMVQTGTSIGIALAPHDAVTPEALLRSADMALYAAKADGRNTFRFFDRGMYERARQRSTLLFDLHRALERGEFWLDYQPQIRLDNRSVAGFEALLRWRHPLGKVIAPGEFIPVAEESGLIVPIGDWVLRSACREAAGWSAALRVAVNLSARQFAAADLVDKVRRALAGSGLAPSRLELEVTESVLIQDAVRARSNMEALRGMGVRVALDDFGTGYSSLAYLRHFPLNNLKIDRSFVAALGGDAGAHAIVEAIVGLARALQLTTTAEGVETPQQLEILRAMGCTEVQGFLFARPMPAAEIAAFLRGW